jgi:S1-C subfamily serine protease
MSILDEFPFPFHKPEAQELVRVLASLYRNLDEALQLAQPFGADPLKIADGLSAFDLWSKLIRQLEKNGAVRKTVKAARDQYPDNPRTPFLDALLDDRPAPVSAEPVSDKGPRFDDTVSKPEALLFFDDLTMPTGRVPNLISTLNKIIAIAPAVCLLRVENAFGSFFGTGFRIGERLVLSNYHVLFPKEEVATKVQADFGFEVDGKGASLPVASLTALVDTIKGEKDDDWAVIEIAEMKRDWPILSLDAAPAPRVGDPAYILQHPGGQQKRLGYVRNTISDVDDRVVKYLTDTEPGSSGSPVFDTEARLIAVHHAGGRAFEVAGKPPVAKNEGIRISRVLGRMKSSGVLKG